MDNFMQNKEFRNDDELKQEVDKFLTSRTRQFWEADKSLYSISTVAELGKS